MANSNDDSRPDLRNGVEEDAIAEGGMLPGRAGGDDVLLVRSGGEFFAVSPRCTHYSGPLSEGLIEAGAIRCPLHHACFSLRTGEALRAPAFDPLARWRVECQGGRVFVREPLPPARADPVAPAPGRERPASVVIAGGGAAGFAAAEMLRRVGYDGTVTLLSADREAPYDRPNLSKDYLAGDMPEDWMPLRPSDYYREQGIDVRLDTLASSIDVAGRRILARGSDPIPFGALLIATGADPVRPSIPGADGPRVHYLRSTADARALIAAASTAARAVVVGASFIGLEVSAALRARNVAVDVVAPEAVPLERVMGRDLGAFVRRLHEAHGVTFHLGESVARVDDRSVTLGSGRVLDADMVVMGVGVRPAIGLAKDAGLAIDKGVTVDQYLETSAPGIFAAGDVAAWPDPRSGRRVRIEHWVVAERQGQIAAKNMLGARIPFDAVPFFWSQHYGTTIRYAGHAESWDAASVDGSLDGPPDDVSCRVTFLAAGRRLAVATIGRDRENLQAAVEMERNASARPSASR